MPGHEYVADDQEKVSTFIALVADIRNSSQHLLCAISGKEADVSELQRVYYETSALLPALERTIQYEDGSVTEYLGDGILSLFYVEEGDKKSAIYAAHRAAKNCVTETLRIANDELNARYRLPPLQIGIGLAMSPALISLVGLPGNSHPKAIGRCVYNATKLSGGRNEILVDTNINREWPTSEGGRLKFIPRTMHNVSGYLIRRKND
ncbi:MAG TPA: adenylate/guanylate cyclase [Acetobacteraceae bacterium]|nr:adenylate/guanylate cyclase [Acetobacteraceae bacterium]